MAGGQGLLMDGERIRSGRLDALTGLRFFAALWVLLYHYQGVVQFQPLMLFVGQGRAGVSLFFVLSGFVLYYTYGGRFARGIRALDFRAFARARFARVYPMHVLALVLITPTTLWYLYGHRAAAEIELGTHITPATLTLSWISNLLLIHIYHPTLLFEEAWNGPSWSIADEFVFYALFPLFVATVLARVRSTKGLYRLAIGLIAIEVGAFVGMSSVSALVGSANPKDAQEFLTCRLPLARIWEFFLGCTLGALYMRQDEYGARTALCRLTSSARMRNAAVAIGLAAIAAIVLLPSSVEAFRWYVLYTPVFALLIAALACGKTFLTPVLEHPRILLLGEASYALYITQKIPLHLFWSMEDTRRWTALAAGLTILCSVALYRYFEIPMRRALRGSAGASAGTLASGAALLLPTTSQAR